MQVLHDEFVFVCPTCRAPLRPLKSNPALGLLCFGCPAIFTRFPEGLYHVREIWSEREYTTTLEIVRLPLDPSAQNGPDAKASDPLARN